jgi:hypothetical protein
LVAASRAAFGRDGYRQGCGTGISRSIDLGSLDAHVAEDGPGVKVIDKGLIVFQSLQLGADVLDRIIAFRPHRGLEPTDT